MVGSDAGLGQSVAHLASVSHGGRDTVSQAELGRQVEDGASILDCEERLVRVLDFHLVVALEVIHHGDLLTLVVERLTHWSFVPGDFVDVVGALVAPVSNDRVTHELSLDSVLELTVLGPVVVFLDFSDSLEASLS